MTTFQMWLLVGILLIVHGMDETYALIFGVLIVLICAVITILS